MLIRDTNEGFDYTDIKSTNDYWFVDYQVEGVQDIEELGFLLARCQSTSTYCRLHSEDYDLRVRRSAKVISADQNHIKLAFPADNISNNIAGLLLAMHVGANRHLYNNIIVDDITPPASYQPPINSSRGLSIFNEYFTGHRPLLIAVCKPSMGLNSIDYAKLVEDAFSGGADIVKDDENLLPEDPDAPLCERIKLITDIMVKIKDNKQKRMFIFNVHGTHNIEALCAEIEHIAEKNNVNFGILLSPLIGIPFIHSIRRHTHLPIFCHSAGISLLTQGPACFSLNAYTKLLRLSGVDSIIIPPPNSPYYDITEENVLHVWNASRVDMNNIPAVLITIAGGLEARDCMPLYTLLKSTSFGFLVGGAIFSDPNGPESGAKNLYDHLSNMIPT